MFARHNGFSVVWRRAQSTLNLLVVWPTLLRLLLHKHAPVRRDALSLIAAVLKTIATQGLQTQNPNAASTERLVKPLLAELWPVVIARLEVPSPTQPKALRYR